MRAPMKDEPVDLRAVIFFYTVACAISWPFFGWRDLATESWVGWDAPAVLKTATYMWGPGLAALAATFLFKKPRATLSLLGPKPLGAAAFHLVPLALLVAAGPEQALLLGTAGFVNVLGEELGWRGFLHHALRPLGTWKRALLTGVLWELWHFTGRTRGDDVGEIVLRVALYCLVAIALSGFLGWVVDRTGAITPAVTLHLWVDLLIDHASPAVFVVAVVAGCFWALVLWRR